AGGVPRVKGGCRGCLVGWCLGPADACERGGRPGGRRPMINLALSWQEAGIAAACLAGAAVAARRSGRPALVTAAGFARETAVVLTLFGLWQLAGTFVLMGPDGAVDRGQWIWQAER